MEAALDLMKGQPSLNILNPSARSEQQIETSRRNGALSRGPISMFGKTRSRKNSTKHGLFASVLSPADTILVKRRDVDEILSNLLRDFDPQTQIEQSLVESLTVNLIRLRIVLQMDMALHDIPASDKFRSPMAMLPPIDVNQAVDELAVLESASRALAAKQPFNLAAQDIAVLVGIFRWVLGFNLPEARSCRRVLDELLKVYPQEEGAPPMTEEFRIACMLDDIFRNQVPQIDLSGITNIITELRELKLRQLAEAKQDAERVRRGMEQDVRHKASNGMVKFETTMRYETHIRRMIEKDLRTLVSLKQLRQQEDMLPIPMQPFPVTE